MRSARLSTRPAVGLLVAAAVVSIISTEAQAQRWTWPEKAENLQVLPEDFPPERLSAVMRGFTRALGVRCSHCHVGEEGQPLSEYDFPSDENPKKDIARTMLKMLGDINEHLDSFESTGAKPVNMWCHTCHRGTARPHTLDDQLMETFSTHGTDAMVDEYAALRERYYGRAAYDFGENSLNALGYALLGQNEVEAAIAVFRLNVEKFSESANVYDSLAEAYMTAGNNRLARIYYEKSLLLDPGNQNAMDKLDEIATMKSE
ncbi:MAG: c-type cytochrome [Rhodothermia bacterium]|nr:c-type cytochrome [Rhodothermia bacterium]